MRSLPRPVKEGIEHSLFSVAPLLVVCFFYFVFFLIFFFFFFCGGGQHLTVLLTLTQDNFELLSLLSIGTVRSNVDCTLF